jgi:hypothetical protein
VVTLALASLAALQMAGEPVPPPTHPGYVVTCRMQDPAGQVSTVRGRTGVGSRQMSILAGGRRSFAYEFPSARFDDSATGFSGSPRVATLTRGGDVVIFYEDHGGAHIQIYAAGTGRPGQNTIARRGRYDRDSHGTCTLTPQAGAAEGSESAG